MTKNDSTHYSFVEGNNFYICDEITEHLHTSIIQPLRKRVEEESAKAVKATLNIYLTSYGGLITVMFDIITLIEKAKKLGVPIHTHVTSYVASAGSMIAIVGHKRFVSESAIHYIHYPRGSQWSHSPEMSKNVHEETMYYHKLAENLYTKYTKDKNVVKKMLTDAYVVLGGEQLIKLGYADELI